jgi:hypothetical protein
MIIGTCCAVLRTVCGWFYGEGPLRGPLVVQPEAQAVADAASASFLSEVLQIGQTAAACAACAAAAPQQL